MSSTFAAGSGVKALGRMNGRYFCIAGRCEVTIVEPGGFRIDFAGSSTTLREGPPEYDATVGKTVRFQREFNGKQPGDPARAAAALLNLVSMENPPLRIVLGSNAFSSAESNDIAKIDFAREWKDLGISTDFPKEVV